jgi:hypothetical protein
MTTKMKDIELPLGVVPIGLSELEAAKMWGISPNLFAKLEKKPNSPVPRARRILGSKRFSRVELEARFHDLPYWNEDPESDEDDEWSPDR